MKNTVILLNNTNLLFLTIFMWLFSCSKNDKIDNIEDKPDSNVNIIETKPNILLIIADDLGKDAINGFSEGIIKPTTPNIDAIRTAGLSFTNFWAYPTCSPTRASIITGKYGYRTGVKWASDELNFSETSLQKYISNKTNNSYSTALVGKWHLSGNDSSINPETLGIDYFAGLVRGEVQNYYNWLLTEDGSGEIVNDYSTEKFTDLAIDWIDNQDKPWFMWLAYNAPHTPFHNPPNKMHSQGNLPTYEDGMDETPYYMAAIEAMDYQIGRLLDSMTEDEKENTIIIFMGDNGSPNQVAQAPYSFFTSKGSLKQGGVNVPLFVSGKGVSRTGNDDNVITSTDLFATITELTGITNNQINDSKSFKSLFTKSTTLRNFQYAEKSDGTNSLWAISNGNYKLIENNNGNKELYNLSDDPYEKSNLLSGTLNSTQTNIKTELEIELLNIRK